MSSRQKAIILSYHQPPKLTNLINALERYGYGVALLVTGRGPNFAVSGGSYQAMGAQIADVFEAYDFPILAVKTVSQAKPTILATGASLAFCLGFPYAITADLLASGIKFVNFHPAPLPLLAGPSAFVWPVLRPDLFPLDKYFITVHYMTPVVDQGPIIKTAKIRLPDGVTERDATATEIYNAAHEAMASVIDEVVRLAKEGFQGTVADPLPAGYSENMARRLTDDERTITSDMTVEQADRIWRARFGAQNPFFRNALGLFHITGLRWLDAESPETVKAKGLPAGAYRVGTRIVQTFRDGALELHVRKL